MVRNSPIKKIARGFCPGGWSGLELTDTLSELSQIWCGQIPSYDKSLCKISSVLGKK